MPLYVAVQNNFFLLAKSLLQNNVNVNEKILVGDTPLAMAIKLLLPEMVRLQYDADINTVNHFGKNALLLAITEYKEQVHKAENLKILELILRQGLKLRNRTQQDYYKLCKAIINYDSKDISRSIRTLKDLNFTVIGTKSPSKFAIYLDQPTTACTPLKKGASSSDNWFCPWSCRKEI